MSFRNPIVAGNVLIPGAMQSVNYEQGTQGWQVSRDGTAEFSNATINGNISASTFTAQQINVGPGGLYLSDGSEALTDIQALQTFQDGLSQNNVSPQWPTPGGIVAGGYLNFAGIPSAQQSTNDEMGICMLTTGYLQQPGWYEIVAGTIPLSMDSGASTVRAWSALHTSSAYGAVPPAPTISSPLVAKSCLYDTPSTRIYYVSPLRYVFYTTTVNSLYLIALLSYGAWNNTSSNNVSISTVQGFPGCEFVCRYMGYPFSDNSGSNLVGGGLKFSPGGGTPPGPPTPPTPTPTRHSTTYYMDWSQSFDGGGNRLTNSALNDSRLYQGGSGITSSGNTRSAFGLDSSSSADLQNRLSGATNISMTLYWSPIHTYNYAGAPFVVGCNSWNSAPSSWTSGTNPNPGIWTSSTYAPGDNAHINVSSKASSFANGTYTGFTFGPAPNNYNEYWAYSYQPGSGSGPYLSVSYTK